MLTLVLVSFAAGVLTVAAPCVLPLLPVIIGGSASRQPGDEQAAQRSWYRPLLITGALAVSVIAFTLLLKATTALLGVPVWVWQLISGGILVLFGITMLLPEIWEWLSVRTGLQARGGNLLHRSAQRGGVGGDILLGAALGPAFSSCSPTYALIVATVLPVSFSTGLVYLTAYALGLSLVLLAIALAGTALVRKLGWLANPHGLFRRIIGGILVLVGIGVVLGWDKALQAFIIEQGWYDLIADLEHLLIP